MSVCGIPSAFKSNAYIKFAETLAMDRFLPSADKGKRERSMALTGEIASLRATLVELQYSKVSAFNLYLRVPPLMPLRCAERADRQRP